MRFQRYTPCLFVTAAALLPLANVAQADVITFQDGLTPSIAYEQNSTYLRSSFPDANTSTQSSLFVGHIASGDDARSLLGFDISAIPVGSTINSITLNLRLGADSSSADADVTLSLHELTGDFDESKATWNNRDLDVPTAWTTAGGDFEAASLSTLVSNAGTVTASTHLQFTSTSNFVAAAQTALDNSDSLDLLIDLVGSSQLTSRSLFRFISEDTSDAAVKKPLLTIDYTPVPEPASFALMGIGVALAAARRRK